MNLNLIIALSAAAGLVPLRAAEPTSLNSKNERISYSIGISIGSAWKSRGIDDLDLDFVTKGIRDALAGKPPLLSDEEVNKVLGDYQTEVRLREAEKRKILGEKNKAEGERFLAQNKTQPGVVTLESGLQYKVLTQGQGPKPGPNDTVTVHYRGALIDGTIFDSSPVDKPATFNVTGVIKGWTEAIQLMKVGSKWQLFIPPDLAYGDAGFGSKIPPSSTLMFEVDLLSTSSPPPAPVVTSDIIKVPSAEELKKGAKIEVIKPEEVEKLQKKDNN